MIETADCGPAADPWVELEEGEVEPGLGRRSELEFEPGSRWRLGLKLEQ